MTSTPPPPPAAPSPAPVSTGSAMGRVYDRGYRPFEGHTGGRRAARAALYRQSLRRALGLRRSWRQKLLPWVLLAVATVPAIVNVGISYLTKDQGEEFSIITYREYLGVSNALLLFVAVAGPDIICPDRRNRTLPLIFARPLTGVDYALAKVGSMFTLMFGFALLPQVVLYLGQVFVSDAALDYFRDHLDVLWQVPLGAAVLAAFHSALILLIASLTTRRLIAAATFLVLLLVSSVIAGVLTEVAGGTSIAGVFNLIALPQYVRDLIFLGEPSLDSPLRDVAGGSALAIGLTATITTLCTAGFVARYRWAES